MSHNALISISPNKVPVNTTMTVRTESDSFSDNGYSITDENGRIIRKGFISERMTEFRLSMVGLAAGVYCFTMGTVNQKFTIIHQ
jgi:plastocyanin domain-containing protein